jgi:hypothetical protein
MKDLPIEILNIIFLQLSLNQKLECFQVCRKWSQVLRSGCLLDTVDFYGIDEIEAFFEFLNDNPHREGQIKRVVLSNNYEADFDIGNLCLYFPKLSTMCLTQARPYSIVYRFSPDPDMAGLEDLRDSITKMIDFGYCNYMEQLLLFRIMPKANLTYIGFILRFYGGISTYYIELTCWKTRPISYI